MIRIFQNFTHKKSLKFSTSRKFFCLITILLTITLNTCYANVNEKLTHECLKKYLKDRQVHEEILDYVDNYIGSVSDCESAVKSTLSGIYHRLRSRLSGDRLSRSYTDCVMREIEEEDDTYELLVLREVAVEMISSWRFWKYWSKSSALEDLQAKSNDIERKLILTCKGHQEFGDYFSQIQDRSIGWSRSGEQEFCLRKVLVEKELVNPNIYNFHYNPRKVREDTLDCNEIFNRIVDELYTEIGETKKISECHLKVYRENKYAENILKSELLSKLSLTTSNRTKEKQDFINTMVEITYDAKKC